MKRAEKKNVDPVNIEAMPFLTKEMILQADDLIREKVEVPEWGGCIYVSMMSAQGRDDFEKSMVVVREDGTTERNMNNFRASLCARTIVNQNGKRMFNTPDEIEQLGSKSAAAIERIFAVSLRLNKIGKTDVEELTKN